MHGFTQFVIEDFVVKFRDDPKSRYNFGEARISVHTKGPHRLFICGGDVCSWGRPDLPIGAFSRSAIALRMASMRATHFCSRIGGDMLCRHLVLLLLALFSSLLCVRRNFCTYPIHDNCQDPRIDIMRLVKFAETFGYTLFVWRNLPGLWDAHYQFCEMPAPLENSTVGDVGIRRHRDLVMCICNSLVMYSSCRHGHSSPPMPSQVIHCTILSISIFHILVAKSYSQQACSVLALSKRTGINSL